MGNFRIKIDTYGDGIKLYTPQVGLNKISKYPAYMYVVWYYIKKSEHDSITFFEKTDTYHHSYSKKTELEALEVINGYKENIILETSYKEII